MTTGPTTLREALDYLAAIELTHDDDGVTIEWYYSDENSTRLWVFDALEAFELVDLFAHTDPLIRADAYSHWCAGYGAEMADDVAERLMEAARAAGDDETVALCRRHLEKPTEAPPIEYRTTSPREES